MPDQTIAPSAEMVDEGSDPTPGDRKPEAVQDLAAEVERWKALSRKNEEYAKANADAAERLRQLEDANKSETERQAETLTQLQTERDGAIAEAGRLRAAVKHGIPDELVDLLGSGTPEEIDARAALLAARVNASSGPRKPGPDPTQGTRADPNTSTAAQFAAALSGL